MYKKNIGKQESEHRRVDIRPKDRGDHNGRRIIRNTKNKVVNENQEVVDLGKLGTKQVYETLRKQIDNKDLGEYLVKVEEEYLGDRGDAVKMPQINKLDDMNTKKVAKSKYMVHNPHGIRLSEKNIRKIQEKMLKEVKPLDIDKRRRLYRMYTFRRLSENSNNALKEEKSDKIDPIKTEQTAYQATWEDGTNYILKQDGPDVQLRLQPVPKEMNQILGLPLVHIRQEVIEESLQEESLAEDSLSENTQTPGTSSPDQKITEAVQTDKPPSARKQEAATSPRKQKQTIPKNRKQSPMRHKRKPVIRTLMTRKGDSTRIYKAVSFVEQKKKAPLKIHMGHRFSRTPQTPRSPGTPRTPHTPRTPRSPNTPSPTYSHKSKHKSSSQSSTNSTQMSLKRVKHKTSPSSIHKLVMNRKFKCKSRRVRHTSPEIVVAPPPVTEVAKWAPQSVNEHTKPYYEAWVNTTLTAISNDNEKMRKEKQRIIQEMQDRLEFHNAFGLSEEELSDEKYTGRIKVTHR